MAKRIDNLFGQIVEFDNIRKSINKACRGKNRYGIEELIKTSHNVLDPPL